MTIHVDGWGFLAATGWSLLVLAAGFAAGRAERRDRRTLAAIEQQHAAAPTTVFARPPLQQDRPALPWLEPEQTDDRMPINPSYGFNPAEPLGEIDRYWLTPEGQRSVEAIDHAYAALPDPEPAETELPGMWERADYTGGLDEVRPPSVAVAQKPDDDRDDDYPRGLAAGIGSDLDEAMDVEAATDFDYDEERANATAVVVRYGEVLVNGHPVRTGVAFAAWRVAPPECRRGGLIERIAARLAPVTAWLAEVRTAVGIDRSPDWRPGEVAAITVVLRRRHASDETSTQADKYEPRHAGETESARRPALPDHSPLPLTLRARLAPTAIALRRQQLASRAAVRRFVAAQTAQGRAA